MDSNQSVNGTTMKVVQAVVSSAELAYLLNLVGASRAYGIDDSLWDADGEQLLGKKIDKGFDSLVQNGWLVVEGEAEGKPRYTINPNLILMAATLADPDVVFVTKRYLPKQNATQEVQVVTHYLTEHLLLEQIKRTDDTYRLMSLPAHSLMIDRLVETLGVPKAAQPKAAAPVDLSWTKVSALDQILRHRNGSDTVVTDAGAQEEAAYAAIREAGIDEAEVKRAASNFSSASVCCPSLE